LGANIDAVNTAGKIGIRAEMSADFVADRSGINCCIMSMDEALTSFGHDDTIDTSWKNDTVKDFANRRKRSVINKNIK